MANKHFKIGKGLTVEGVTSRPSDPQNGDIIFRSDTQVFEQYTNGVWSAIGSGSGGSSIEGIFTAGEDLLKGQVVQIIGSDAFLFQPEIRFSISKNLGIVKEDTLATNSVTIVFGGTFDAGVSSYLAGYDYFGTSDGAVDVYGSAAVRSGKPLIRIGTALSDQILAIDFSIFQDHKFPQEANFNLFNYGQATSNLDSYNPFIRYKDAASALPVDGTGGSPTVAQIPSYLPATQFQGNTALYLSKTASNGQGEGWSFDITVPAVSRTKVHTIQFDYIVDNGTFVPGTDTTTGDINVYFYDVTNSTLVQPAGFKLTSNSTTLTGKVSAEFQIPFGCAVGRVIFHIASTSTSAFGLLVDNIKVVPNKVNLGAVVTDLKQYTPTISHDTGGATNYTASAFWRQVGDKVAVEGNINFTGTSAAFSGVFISYPPGLTPDTTKMSNTGANRNKLGYGSILDAGLTITELGIYYNDTSKVTLYVPGTRTGANPQPIDNGGITQAYPFASGAANGDTIKFYFEFPAAGKSSNLVLSQDITTRTVAAKMTRAGASQNISSGVPTKVAHDVASIDSVGMFNLANNRLIAQVPGYYKIIAQATLSAASTTSEINSRIHKNGVEVGASITRSSSIYSPCLCQELTWLNVGDYIEHFVAALGTGTLTLEKGSQWTYLSLERISGPEQIAASESVNCSVHTSSQTISTGVNTTVIMSTKDYDSHNAYNTSTGIFTAPISGKYRMTAGIEVNSATWSSPGLVVNTQLVKNGTIVKYIGVHFWQAALTAGIDILGGSGEVHLNQGDTLNLGMFHNRGGNVSLASSSAVTYLMISRIGN